MSIQEYNSRVSRIKDDTRIIADMKLLQELCWNKINKKLNVDRLWTRHTRVKSYTRYWIRE
jgi:hypothetical protein